MICCEEYAPALSAFIDGELSEKERAQLLAHLGKCEACSAYLAELTAMRAAWDDMEELDAPEGFAESVMARLHKESAPAGKRAKHSAKGWRNLAACAAVVLLVGAFTLPRLGMGKASEEEALEAPAEATAEDEAEFSDSSESVQLFFTPAEDSVAEKSNAMEDRAEASGSAQHAVVLALSDEAEQYLIEQGCEVLENSDIKCSYLAPVEVVHNMAALGLITENGEDLVPLEELAEGSVEVIVRMAQRGGNSGADPSAPTAEQSMSAEHEVLP